MKKQETKVLSTSFPSKKRRHPRKARIYRANIPVGAILRRKRDLSGFMTYTVLSLPKEAQ